MKKRTLTIALTLFLLLILLAACSGGDNLNGTWINGNFNALKISGKSISIQIGSNKNKGTYSIWGDKIEFVYDDGEIEVLSFSRTKNTVTIDGKLFTKQ